MSGALLITWLGRLCLAGAAGAIIVYVIHLAGRQGWRRPWNAAGLFFSAIVLTQLPFLFENSVDRRGLTRAVVTTACLLIATALQAYTALRRRRERAPEPPAEGPAA